MAKNRYEIPKEGQRLVDALKSHVDEIANQQVDRYLKHLVSMMNWQAQSILAQRQDSRSLTFTGKRTDNKLTLTPSDPELFAELEFGNFNSAGEMISPPSSVLDSVKVLLDQENKTKK